MEAVEKPDVVEAQETSFENIAPFGVLAVHPPSEVEEQLWNTRSRKSLSGGKPCFDLRRASMRQTAMATQAWTGGLTSNCTDAPAAKSKW